jgi:cell division protein FtsL
LIQTKESYVHGTAARKLEYNVYEENTVLKAKRKQRSNNKAKAKMVLYIMTVFAMCFVVMLRYTQITELNYKIERKNKEFHSLRNDNSRLKVAIEKEMDLNKVRELAQQKLGMQKPDKYQVVYIKVLKNDFTKVAGEGKGLNKTETGALVAVMNEVGKLASFLE